MTTNSSNDDSYGKEERKTPVFAPELRGRGGELCSSDAYFVSRDGGLLHLHRVVLQGVSDFFKELCFDDCADQEGPIPLDAGFEQLKVFFSLLYCDDMSSHLEAMPWTIVLEVAELASKYVTLHVLEACCALVYRALQGTSKLEEVRL